MALSGCGGFDEVETSATTQELKCDSDPLGCNPQNGHGVYFEELGRIGIGPSRFMITNFRNVEDGDRGAVIISGRYWEASTNTFKFTTATVKSIKYTGPGSNPNHGYTLASVEETYTTPTITLKYGTAGTLPVTGSNLQYLQLVLQLVDGYYTVSFTIPTPAHERSSDMFAMSWNTGTTYNNPQPYCRRADLTSDPVVFQQGIVVNPANAILTRVAGYTTLSCRYGAPATVRSWGYIHRGNAQQSDLFEAAMHMKRASYCGDASFYTIAETGVLIDDMLQVQNTALTPTIYEASWGADASGKIRALCVRKSAMRHTQAVFPLSGGAPFDGDCGGFQIPECQDSNYTGNFSPAPPPVSLGILANQAEIPGAN